MYQGLLFSNMPKAVSIPPQFNYLNSMMNDQYDRIRYMHNLLTITVLESNLLVQLLQSLPFRLTGDPIIDVRNASGNLLQIASTHNLVTDATTGKIHSKAILPFEGAEVIFAVARPFDVKKAKANWQSLAPVKIISHPYMDLNYPIFTETLDKNYSVYNTPVVKGDKVFAMEVDIPMLVFQMACWAEVDVRRTIRNFVAMYPITNMVPSYMDVSMMNRHFRQAIDPIGKINFLNTNKSFTLNLAPNQVETAFKEVRERIRKQNRDIPTILAEINLPFGKPSDILDTAFYFAGTRQSRWALDFAYMPIIRGLLKIDAAQTVRMSLPIKRALRKGYNQMIDSRFLDSVRKPMYTIDYVTNQLTDAVKHC